MIFFATALAAPLTVQDMTRGIRFEPPLLSIAEHPQHANLLFLGNHKGRFYLSQDRGESWVENSILIHRMKFSGATYAHRFTVFEPLYFLNEGILPSPGQVFSFNTLIDLNQKLPQAEGFVRSFFNRGIESNPYTQGFIFPRGRHRASWRLSEAVRSKKGWGIGVDWRSLVRERSSSETHVNYIIAHPQSHQDIFAATSDGLFRSRDGGDSWPLVLGGTDRIERNILFVTFHPTRPEEIWVGTEGGLRISRDGGQTYEIPAHPLANSSDIHWITFDHQDPQVVYLGVGWSLLKSTDGGQNFGVAFIHPWPALSHVRRIMVDPFNPQRVLIGTRDGLMLSENQGASFERVGGLLFIGQEINSIVPGRQQGHYLVATKSDLWQTFDGGRHWSVAYFGAINWDIRMVIPSRHSLDTYWILTTAEVLKMSFAQKTQIDRTQWDEFQRRVKREPTMSDSVNAGLNFAGVHRRDRLALRKRASLSALLPIIDAGWAYRHVPLGFDAYNALVSNSDDNEVRRTNFNDAQFNYSVFGVFAWWDLHKLIYHTGERPSGRGESLTNQLNYKIRTLIINLFQERRTLMESIMLKPSFGRTRLMRFLRFEELTAHLNQLTRDLFPPFIALSRFSRGQF